MQNNNNRVALFLFGLFAVTEVRIVGSIAISELLMSFMAPFVFMREYKRMAREGFIPMILLLSLTMIGCIIASKINHTPIAYFLRGVAAIYVTLAALICAYHYLRDDLSGAKWFFLGYALSNVVNIFIFQRGTTRSADVSGLINERVIAAAMGSALFWVERIPHWLYVPIRWWDAKTPFIYTLSAPILVAGISLFFSRGSGRSAALCALATFCLLLIRGSSTSGLQRIKRHFFVAMVILLMVGLAGKMTYQYLAENGMLGAAGLKKFEQQTKSGNSVLAWLMSGRGEFFAGLYCAVHNPIWGYGPWAVDRDGLAGDFLREYGAREDYEVYLIMQRDNFRNGGTGFTLPSHSSIVGFWTWYGIFGLMLWLYIIYLYWKTIRDYFISVPQWFGCVATILPTVTWDAFFSPYGHRVFMGMFFCMCLIMKYLYKCRQHAAPTRLLHMN